MAQSSPFSKIIVAFIRDRSSKRIWKESSSASDLPGDVRSSKIILTYVQNKLFMMTEIDQVNLLPRLPMIGSWSPIVFASGDHGFCLKMISTRSGIISAHYSWSCSPQHWFKPHKLFTSCLGLRLRHSTDWSWLVTERKGQTPHTKGSCMGLSGKQNRFLLRTFEVKHQRQIDKASASKTFWWCTLKNSIDLSINQAKFCNVFAQELKLILWNLWNSYHQVFAWEGVRTELMINDLVEYKWRHVP